MVTAEHVKTVKHLTKLLMKGKTNLKSPQITKKVELEF